VLHVIAGADAEDPGSARKGFAYVPQFDRKITDFTIGYAPIDFERAAPEAQAAFKAALDVMKNLGAKFKEVEIPDFPYQALVETVIGAEAASIFEDFIRGPQIEQMADPSQAATLKSGLDISAVNYLKAMRIRSLVRSAFREMFYDIDMLLAPSRPTPAPRIADGTGAGAGTPVAGGRGLTGIIPAGNLAGLPAISLPCGFASGVPVGISLIGRPWFENHLIGVGRAFQSQTDWHKRKPPVESI
jgi:aspartyl-tRNA(Asn)/glutamyl-tRNA(Gln) amidotransferase subunit A